MRKLSFIVGLGLLLAGCQTNSHDLKIPDTVAVTKAANAQQFPATRVFMEVPKGYELARQVVEFQRDSDTYVKVQEQDGADFYKAKPYIIKLEKEDPKKLKQFYRKEFKFGIYDAVLFYGEDVKPNQESIALVFGDHRFVVFGYGGMKTGDNEARTEILKSLLSMYIDTKAKVDVTGLAGFTLDVSGSDFGYEGNLEQQVFIYTIGGIGDPANSPFEDQITVTTLPAMTNEAKMLYAQKLLEGYKSRMEISDIAEKEMKLNGNYAYEMTFKSVYRGRKSIGYQLVTGNDKATIFFVSSIYNRPDVLMPQVEKIVQTLKLK